MADVNTMQATLGLSFGTAPQQQPKTPSPAETSLQLMEAARNQMLTARQNIGSAVSSMAQQFQANYEALQASTYNMNPQVAQALQAARNPYYGPEQRAQNPFGAQGGMLPSPLQMTPAETGVFRPRAQGFNFQPLPPIAIPSWQNRMLAPIGMGAQLPMPMYQSVMEQRQAYEDRMSMMDYAQASQIPGVLGAGMGLGAAAFAGARFGSKFGRFGAMAGAGLGALGAGLAGIPSAIGNLADTITGVPYETIQMGASLQNFTRNFVTAGPGLAMGGRGLNREAARDLASGLREIASQDSTFNRQDLMQIVNQGGQAGLFDMAQSVPDIKNKVRETANTIREFMSLTNDPDLTSVIRQMGQMNQMGMTQGQMVQAAQGMRMYAKQAGTTIQGLKDIGGTPGSYAFQQMGLTAGQGFMYGNFAAASARNLLATGNMSPRDLALLGGVSGITQRDIMSQAAFAGMPLFGAMNAQFGAKGWDAANRPGGYLAAGGAAGMVTDAYRALSAGVQEGGVGALATYMTSQRQIADKALAKMTPEEMMAQRYNAAMNTGKSFGLSGMSALSFGAQAMFGLDNATQMVMGAGTPGFLQTQLAGLYGRGQEAALQQQARIGSRDLLPNISAPGFLNKFLGGVGQLGGAAGDTFNRFSEALADLPLVGSIPAGMNRTRFGDAAINSTETLLRIQDASRTKAPDFSPVATNAGGAGQDLLSFYNNSAGLGTAKDVLDYLRKNVPGVKFSDVSALASSAAKDIVETHGSALKSFFQGDVGLVNPEGPEGILQRKAQAMIPGWDKLPADKRAQVLQAMMGLLRQQQGDPDLQKTLSSAVSNASEEASKKRQDILNQLNTRQASEINDLFERAGLGRTDELFKDQSQKLMDWMGDNNTKTTDLLTVLGVQGGKQNADTYYQEYRRLGGKADFEGFLVKGQDYQRSMGAKLPLQGLREIAEKGLGLDLVKQMESRPGSQLAGMYLGAGDVLSRHMKAGKSLEDIMARGTGDLDVRVASGLDVGTFGEGQKKLAEAVGRLQSGNGTDADRTILRQFAGPQGARGKVAETAQTTVFGPEAKRLQAGAEALQNLNTDVFSQLSKPIGKFNDGVEAFQQAAEALKKHFQ